MKIWLKGGLIALGIFIIAFGIFSITGENLAMLMMLVFFLGENPLNPFLIAGYFVIGAIIGWLIQKFKR